MNKKIKKNKAFTLLELLIVVAIIGLLIAIAVPTFQGIMARGRDTAIKADMRSIRIVADMMRAEGKDFSTVHCNPGGAPEIRAICDKVRGNSPHPDQIRSFATVRSFCIQAPLHSRKFWRVDSAGFSGYDLCGYVGRWDMDEGTGTRVYDRSGNANHGTMHNFASPHGWVGGALSFDGVDDRVFVGERTIFRKIDGTGFSWVVWFRGKPGFPPLGTIIDKLYPIIIVGEHNAVWAVLTRTPPADYRGPGLWFNHTFTDNTWYKIVGVHDGHRTMRVFFQGRLVGELHEPHPLADWRSNLYFGHAATHWYWGARAFRGTIGSVRIFQRALTAEEVYALFRRGR